MHISRILGEYGVTEEFIFNIPDTKLRVTVTPYRYYWKDKPYFKIWRESNVFRNKYDKMSRISMVSSRYLCLEGETLLLTNYELNKMIEFLNSSYFQKETYWNFLCKCTKEEYKRYIKVKLSEYANFNYISKHIPDYSNLDTVENLKSREWIKLVNYSRRIEQEKIDFYLRLKNLKTLIIYPDTTVNIRYNRLEISNSSNRYIELLINDLRNLDGNYDYLDDICETEIYKSQDLYYSGKEIICMFAAGRKNMSFIEAEEYTNKILY